MPKHPSILLIYTGGTIGMIQDQTSGELRPFDFRHLTSSIPELKKFDMEIATESFEVPIDSSNMNPAIWYQLSRIIEKNYKQFDGFVILHGSDTMAYTASALSFMLEGLNKPVILTGSQLPIGIIRTDGKENLITAVEIAGAQNLEGKPIVPEVCIYFEYQLYRGNRTHKYNSEHFDAFTSSNYPVLAEAGVKIKYDLHSIRKWENSVLKVHGDFSNDVGILKIFPGISEKFMNSVLSTPGLRGLIIETFGAGNAPTDEWFLKALSDAINKGIIILNVTQCNAGSVSQGRYETSASLSRIGVIGGRDITVEAAIAKLMHLLGRYQDIERVKDYLQVSIAGEMTQ